jgi:Fe2+ or Zn2+ uptake regulation protein
MPHPDRSSEEDLAERLSRHGLRITRQRVATLRLLEQMVGHPTANEIHDRLLRRHPNVSLKTVYDILGALVEAGLAARVGDAGGAARFELRSRPSRELWGCGRLFDIPASADARSQTRRVAERFGRARGGDDPGSACVSRPGLIRPRVFLP